VIRSLVIAGIVAALAGSASPAVAVPPDPGTCFTYTTDQWAQTGFSATTGDCSNPHNGEVLGTVWAPPEIAVSGWGSEEVKAWAFRACAPIGVDYVWTRGRLKLPTQSYVMPRSARLNVQLPKPDEWSAGQRWATCIGQSRNVRLSAPKQRVSSVRGLGFKPYVCLNPRGWRGMKCTKIDAVRLTHQVWIPKAYGQTYPGRSRMLKKTERMCRALIKKRKKWTLRSYYVPGLAAWERGNKFGFCEIIK
jgi:hypothetical protein